MTFFSLRLVAAIAVLFPLTLRAVEMNVTCNRSDLYIGESFILSVNVRGTTAVGDPDVSGMTNCVATLVGKSPLQQMTFINGAFQRSEEVAFSYEVRPLSAGTFTPGPIRVTYESQTLESSGTPINVLGVDNQDYVLLSVDSSTNTVWVDEPFQVTLHVRLKRLPAPFTAADPILPDSPPHLYVPFLEEQLLRGLHGTNPPDVLGSMRIGQPNIPSFLINHYAEQLDPFGMGFPFGPSQQQPKRYMFPRTDWTTNGTSYFDYAITLNYTADRLGDITFGPVEYKGNVPVHVEASGQAQTRPIFAVGAAATVRVIPPPDKDRPASFIGALATGISATATLDTHSCQIGDPLKLTIEITGIPHPDQSYPPDISAQPDLWQAFKLYPDSLITSNGANSCIYTYTVRPTAPGTHEFPPIDVSYFDAAQRSYKTIHTLALPIQVIDNPEVDVAAIMSSQQKTTGGTRSIEITSKIVAPLGAFEDTLQPSTIPGPPTAWYIMGLGPVVYLLTRIGIWIYRSNPTRRTQSIRRRALGQAHAQLRRFSKRTAVNGDAGHLCEIIRNYLADSTQTHTRGLTPPDLTTMLQSRGVQPEYVRELTNLYETLFAAGFSHSTTPTQITPDTIARIKALLATIDPLMKSGIPS